jgi:hypothetical protein
VKEASATIRRGEYGGWALAARQHIGAGLSRARRGQCSAVGCRARFGRTGVSDTSSSRSKPRPSSRPRPLTSAEPPAPTHEKVTSSRRHSRRPAAGVAAGLMLSVGIGIAYSRLSGRQDGPEATVPRPPADASAWSPTDPATSRVQLKACLKGVRQAEADAGDGAGPVFGDDWEVTAAVALPPTSYPVGAVRRPNGRVEQLATPTAVPAPPMWFVAGRENRSENLAECVVKTSPGGGFEMHSSSVGPSALQGNYLPAPAVLKGVLEYGGLGGLAYGYYGTDAGRPYVEADGVRYPTYAQAGVFISVLPARSSAPNPQGRSGAQDSFASAAVLTTGPQGQVLSTQTRRLSALVASRPCWNRPGGTPVKQRTRGETARGDCGTAIPPASR